LVKKLPTKNRTNMSTSMFCSFQILILRFPKKNDITYHAKTNITLEVPHADIESN
jgi:hypothetical protein